MGGELGDVRRDALVCVDGAARAAHGERCGLFGSAAVLLAIATQLPFDRLRFAIAIRFDEEHRGPQDAVAHGLAAGVARFVDQRARLNARQRGAA